MNPDRVLDAFNRWFTSRRGVWQVAWLSVVVTAAEFIWPHLDRQHFMWLFLCTVWSFVTQNCLACAAREAAEGADRDVRQLQSGEDSIAAEIHTITLATHELVRQIHTEKGNR